MKISSSPNSNKYLSNYFGLNHTWNEIAKVSKSVIPVRVETRVFQIEPSRSQHPSFDLEITRAFNTFQTQKIIGGGEEGKERKKEILSKKQYSGRQPCDKNNLQYSLQESTLVLHEKRKMGREREREKAGKGRGKFEK